MTNTYGTGNGLLNQSTYGNQDYVNYVYDDLGRTTRINKNGSNAYYWRYNANGDVAMHTDYAADRVYYYTYDSLGRIVTETEKTRGEDEYRFSNSYAYDSSNNLTKLVCVSDGKTITTNYTYDAANRPKSANLGGVTLDYTYTQLGALNTRTLNTTTPLKTSYAYHVSARNEDSSTLYRTSQLGWETIGNDVYRYDYDKTGNLTRILYKNTADASYTTRANYFYDKLGQLIRENNLELNKTIMYNYDNGGNLTSKSEYPYTTGDTGTATKTVNYTYDSTWKDKLISYDGDSITYDEIGNPETYRDSMSFTWQGRQMKTANLNGTSVTYKYNADGLRTYKKVGSTVHEYEYAGDKLIYEKRGDIKFQYRYDPYGNIASIRRVMPDGLEFTLFTITNARGDVVELRMSNGVLYARYVYDSWGNVVHVLNPSGYEITDLNHYAHQNPFRYRGYYYDAESGLYYLQSRYYDPVTGRFVNPDSLVDTSDVLGFNMYAYCGNNPVSREDGSGNLWDLVFDIASIAYSAFQVYKEPNNLRNWAGLVADAVSLVIPGITGGGAAVRAMTKADDIVDATRAVSKADDVADVARAADKTYDGVRSASNVSASACFVAGTQILTENGTENIEDIKSGDIVWATNPETKDTELKKVVQTFVNETDELVYVQINGDDIVATPEHPFYVSNCGWIGAIDLRAGDKLVLVNGEYAVVENVQHEILERPIKVYNFEVEDFHTYYVGDTGVLVHNTCYSTLNSNNYRKNALIYNGSTGADVHVHHVYPQKFEGFFNNVGINIHSPIRTTLMDPKTHLQGSSAYNKAWEGFISSNPYASQSDVIQFAGEATIRIFGGK